MEGAGVHLRRAFGFHEVPLLDPFLLLDDFGSDNPDDYLAGFPWHHRAVDPGWACGWQFKGSRALWQGLIEVSPMILLLESNLYGKLPTLALSVSS
jgi:hypothetical protein